MITSEILNKPLFSMTGAEIITLVDAIQGKFNPNIETRDYTDKNIGKGIDGIARVLQCGKTKAQNLKNKGVFDEAIISQQGEGIRFLKDKLIQCYHDYNK